LEDLAQSQTYTFIIYILSGILIGVFFDIFRIHRRSFKTPDAITYIQDILFWMITGIFLLYIIFKFNNGELRWYIFLGIMIGINFYMLIFSKYFININVVIVKFFKNLFIRLWKYVSIFLRFFKNIVFSPISFIFINVRKAIKQLISNFFDVFKHKKTKKIEN